MQKKLQKSVEDLSLKIGSLSISNNNLQMEVNLVSESFQNPTAPVGTSVKSSPASTHASASSAVQNIVDELAYRDGRKKNVILSRLTVVSHVAKKNTHVMTTESLFTHSKMH